MFWWLALFFILAVLCRPLLRLPPLVWKSLFALPYVLTFAVAVTPFFARSWDFPRDGLSDFFACIVTGIGFCVAVYAGAYFNKEDAKRFYPLLFFFTGAMLGVLWSDNIFYFYAFWEATSLCSFLLIAFNYEDAEVRKKARQALLVNTAGGLALLTALLILSSVVGSYSLTDIFAESTNGFAKDHTVMFLIIFAAVTKSAQFPLHFWLPNAMKAPTPASCYLHSATMVKLGVFLLARFTPLFDGATAWTTTLSVVGAITLIWGLLVSLVKTDLKLLFAWTTVSSLGALFILIGLPYSYSWRAFFSYLFAHSCYKASLFLCVGNIDKQIGTRNIYSITDLVRRMPVTSLALTLSLGSMIGLPFSLGFLGKEYLLKSALLLKGPGSLLIAVLVCSSALSFVVAYRVLKLIFQRDPRPNRFLREAPAAMWLPALALSAVGWVLSFFLDDINQYFLNPVVSSILLTDVNTELEMWTGFNAGIGLSIISLFLGVMLSWGVVRHVTHFELWLRLDRNLKERLDVVSSFAKLVTSHIQNGRLSTYLFAIFLSLWAWVLFISWRVLPSIDDLELHLTALDSVPLALIILGLLPLFISNQGLFQVLGLGVVGLGVGLVFLQASATDVAMTQIAVEMVSVFILVFFLKALRMPRPRLSVRYQWGRVSVTALSFLASLWLGVLLDAGKVDSRITGYFVENASELARGLNVVNVILVDFRALDTMGEITVLGIVALALYALFKYVPKRRATFSPSPLIEKGISVFSVLFLVVAVYVLFRGHNAPGGGFIAGLLLAISVGFYALVHGVRRAAPRLAVSPRIWIGSGLLLALSSGLFSWLAGRGAPFTSVWFFESPSGVGTPLIFDIGVFMTVVGVMAEFVFAVKGRTHEN